MHDLHQQVAQNEIANHLMLLEHAPVITITESHKDKSIKTTAEQIKESGIDLEIADRGGDVTFHGPGQLVGYPLFHVGHGKNSLDVEKFIRSLESALLHAVHSLGATKAITIPGFTGIWIKTRGHDGELALRKIVAIGVGIKNGVSKHGFAMNYDIDYQRYAKHIIPCGLKDRGVITLREVFYSERLPMPAHSVMVKTVAESLATTFNLKMAHFVDLSKS